MPLVSMELRKLLGELVIYLKVREEVYKCDRSKEIKDNYSLDINHLSEYKQCEFRLSGSLSLAGGKVMTPVNI